MKKSLRVADYLSHIQDAIQRIRRYTDGKSELAFAEEEQLQDAVIRNIEVIGEAARNIETHAPAFAQQHPAVPWAALDAMRNRVAHGDWTIDLTVVWRVIERDLPDLEDKIRKSCPNSTFCHEVARLDQQGAARGTGRLHQCHRTA